jgi:E3 ubiquitin ligase SMURF1/2
MYNFKNSENNISNVIESTFSVENNSFGVLKVHELKPNGQQIAVNEDNKREYVKLYVNYRFMRGIEQQFLALQKGIFQLPEYLTQNLIKIFLINNFKVFAN